MKAPVLNTIPQIQAAIAELYKLVGELQEKQQKEEAPVARRGRPRQTEAETSQEG